MNIFAGIFTKKTIKKKRSGTHIGEALENFNYDPYITMDSSHAIAIITEWDEFKNYDWEKVYDSVQKPAFIFDGRNILDRDALSEIGFNYKSIVK
jgi:UDPglucose 6-dehydrogenase